MMRHLRVVLLGSLLLSAGDTAWAVAKRATAAGGGTWATATWAPAGVPAAGDTCTINDAVNLTVTTAAVCGSLAIGDNSGSGNATLTLTTGSLDITTAGGQSGNVVFDPAASGNTYTIVAATQTVTIRGTVACGNSGVITVSTGQVLFTRALGLTWPAGCTLTVTNNNAAGSVNFTGLLTQTGGTIRNTTTAGTINFNAGYTKSGGTFTTLNGESINFAGNLAVSGGALAFANTSIATFTASATITPTSAITFGSLVVNPGSGNTVTLAGNVSTVTGLTVSTGTFNLATFTANRTLAGGTLTVSNGAALQIGGTNSFPTNYTTHTLGASSTVEYNGTTQAVTAENYGHLTLTGSGTTKTPAAGTYNIAGNFTVNNGVTFAGAANPVINLSGDFTENGTYTSGTGVFTFTGAAAQTWSGNSTTITNLTINKSSNSVSITSGTSTVTGTLTLTSGNIVTAGATCAAATPLIVDVGGTISGGAATSYVQGVLRKNFNANSTLNFRATATQDEFPIGTAALGYTPIEITAGGTSTAGSITACVTALDHPSMSLASSGGIDISRSVNLYWSMTTATINTLTGVGAALMDATFKFNAGNVDGIATTGNFIAERWDGTKWSPTTRVSAGATSTRVQNVDISSTTNEFEIGEPFATFPPALGSFNAFDTSAPAGAVIGVIQTKQAGTSFSLRIVSISNNAVNTAFNTANVSVELRDASDNTGGFTTGCRSTWGPPATLIGSITVNFASGVATAVFPANQIPNVYRDVRVRISAGAGCSSDRFAIRPTTITVDAADSDWQNAGTGRTLATISATSGAVHAASDPAASTPRPFTLRVTPQAGGGQSASRYDGLPTLVSGFPVCCTPSTTPACSTLPASCTLGTLSFTGGSWSGTGIRTNATAHYTEAGVINLQFEDTTFAAVDANDGSTAATRTVPATGTGSIGRFVPDNFIASALVTPTFLTFNTNDASCTAPPSGPKRSFTYVGQGFGFGTGPSVRITARNAAGNTTTNYKGSLWKVGAGGTSSVAKDCTTNANVCLFTTTWSTPAAGSVAESYSYTLTPASTPNWDNGIATGTAPTLTINNNGTGDFAFAAGAPGDRLAFKRDATTPLSTFTASINNAITVTDDTEAGTGGNGTLSASLTFSSIVFDAGNGFRYGVVRLQDVFAPLAGNSSGYAPVAILTQYWNGTAFVTNTEDNCTSFTEKNFVLYSPLGAITAANLPTPTAGSNGNVSMGVAPVSSGVGRVNVIGPSPAIAQPGSVKICLDLDLSTSQIDNACVAITPANKAYLQGRWSGANYDKDPNATVGFGLYGSQPKNFIYFRENY
jgi:hypothetical protein